MRNSNIDIARQIIAQNERLLAMLEGNVVTAAPVERKARKARKAAPKASKAPKAEKAESSARLLTQDSRRDFIAAHDWAADHTSTRALVEAVVVSGQPLAEGWEIGPKYRAMFADAPVEPKAEPKKAKKARKVAAKVEPEAPAKERKPVGENHASQGPRDAKGRITPKVQWEMRESLAMSAQFSREAIDEIVTAHFANA